MSRYLDPKADIIHSPYFDSAVVKIMKGEEAELLVEEKIAMKSFLLNANNESVYCEDANRQNSVHGNDKSTLPFMDRLVAKRQKRMSKAIPSTRYINPKFLLCTSNVVERLFSLAKLTFGDYRKRMSSSVFQALLFLQKNQLFWNVSDVAMAMQNSDLLNSCGEEEEDNDEEVEEIELRYPNMEL
jgi:hypothetical protein